MITKISIENFKGIGDRVTIPIRPITLLFGPNSAGKSTIMHAIHYAREILERHNLDVNGTVTGGDSVDLGGFCQLIHRHDLKNSVRLRFDFETEELWNLYNEGASAEEVTRHLRIDENLDSWASSLGETKQAAVELVVSWSHLLGKPFVSAYRLYLAGELFSEITASADGRSVVLETLKVDNPAITTVRGWGDPSSKQDYDGPTLEAMYPEPDASCLDLCLRDIRSQFTEIGDGPIPLLGMRDALPRAGWDLRTAFLDRDNLRENGGDEERALWRLAAAIMQELSDMITAPLELLRSWLRQLRYVGPIREVPPPDHTPPRYLDHSRWASGLAAWDMLASPGNSDLVQSVSDWLWNDDRLDTGYQVEAKRVREIESYLQERMLRMEWEEGEPSDLVKDIVDELESLPERQRVYLRDVEKGVDLPACSVGLGISQVVPVIVAVLDQRGHVVQLEQPCLHLHPTQQAAVGDLLIEGALRGSGKTLLVETHSEHMILRILRRIRQTNQGQPFNDIAVRPEHVIALYVEPRDGQTNTFEIAIGEDGEFLQPWPDKFFDQDYEERYG